MRREHILLIKRMDRLIRMKATGNYLEFAGKLEISPAKLYRLLDLMRDDLEAPIIYNKQRGSFEYSSAGQISIGFGLTPVNKQNMAGLTGGNGYNNFEKFGISQEMRNNRLTIDPEKFMLNLNH